MHRAHRLKAALIALCITLAAGLSGARAQDHATPVSPPIPPWTRGAADKVDASSADLHQTCTGPGATPLCALKTYLACVLYDAPDLCVAVGLKDIPERYPGPDTLDTDVLSAPWSLPFDRLMPEAFALHIYDGGLIPASRFQTARLAGKEGRTKPVFETIPAQTSGAYEVMVDIPEPYVKGLVYSLSFFFRQENQNWRLVAWSSSRAKACDSGFGTAAWAPCRWFVKNLRLRNVFAADVSQIWASPRLEGHDDYPYPGLEIMSGMPNQPATAFFAGTIVRRCLKYPDMPLYDWVVLQGENRQSNMTLKLGFVDRTGPTPGAHVEAAEALGTPQWVEREYAGAGRFVHMELLRDGQQIDPRSVMRERRAQDSEK